MSEEQTTGALSKITDAVADLVVDGATALPAPIRKNFWKAFGQLCSAAADWPAAIMEGKAAEARAESQARTMLINTSAEQVASQMSVDPAYARIAAAKYTQRVIQEQINLDKVCNVAAQELSSTASQAKSSEIEEDEKGPQMSDDWLDSFSKEACGKSSEEMQILFGKILAGEIKKPESFSIRTVKLMGQLDSRAANLFRRLCSLSVVMENNIYMLDCRVPSFGSAAQNSLSRYGLSFGELNVLQEYGLIISDYNSFMNYGPAIAHNNTVGCCLRYGGSLWGLVPDNPGDWQPDRLLKVYGVCLSNAGKELSNIVEIEPDEQYTSALNKYFLEQGLRLTSISRGK